MNCLGILIDQDRSTGILNHDLVYFYGQALLRNARASDPAELRKEVEAKLRARWYDIRLAYWDPYAEEVSEVLHTDGPFYLSIYVDAPFHSKAVQ